MTVLKSRYYELVIGSGNTAAIVKPPLNISFSATKSINGYGVNRASCMVYNLKESTRLSLVKDAEDISTHIPFILYAGYEDRYDIIFKGSVHIGFNKFEQPNFITSIISLDGGVDFLTSFTSATVRNEDSAYNKILSDMPNTSKGRWTGSKKLSRPRVLFGSSVECLASMLDPDETWYIDNEQLYIIKENEVVSRYIPIVSADTGLLNTPERQNRIVTCQTKLNPSLKIGGLCELKSKVAPHLNGVYKIYSMEYNCELDGDAWDQTLSMQQIEGYTVL